VDLTPRCLLLHALLHIAQQRALVGVLLRLLLYLHQLILGIRVTLLELYTQLASYPPPVPHSPPVDAGVGWASAAATAAATSSRMRLRTAASDSGASPPAGAGADEGGGEVRSHSVMTRRRKMKFCQHKLRMMLLCTS
jgi:hypothetical protein